MAWIESHQTLGRHPKLMRLAGQLRIHRAQALGHLQYLWWWALDYAPTGDVSALAPAEISAASEWQGEPSLFQKSLVECGWLDGDGKIHDWMEYAGRLVEERRRDAERKRMSRSMSAGHPADGGRTATVPNPTLPNPTQHNPKDKDGGLKRSDCKFIAVASGFTEKQKKNSAKSMTSNGNEIYQRPENQNHMLDRIVEFSNSEDSRAFFQKAIKKLGEGIVEEAIGEVKMRDANGSVHDVGKYLVALLENWMENRK